MEHRPSPVGAVFRLLLGPACGRPHCSRSSATRNGGSAIVRAEVRVFGGPSHRIDPDS
ncbi:hypothetical protein [Amycolatopsis kentuckyensis]|uniref:hypothetical protein n=1 Tax=Amycolatopsis kentuckyensis TaxID=218823 RepID=UPI0035657EE0